MCCEGCVPKGYEGIEINFQGKGAEMIYKGAAEKEGLEEKGMKVNNTSIFMGDDTLRARHEGKTNPSNQGTKTIDGNAFKGGLDPITAKKEEARKKAMKLVGDAFSKDRSVDDDLKERHERIKSLQKDKGDANRAIKEIEDDRAVLREAYDVDENSQEEADLKLLEKEVKAKMPGSDVRLSKDDMDAIERIKANGLTEYQERSLEMLESEIYYADIAYEADEEIETENRVISATKIERLKYHTMEDAQKEADDIMDMASEEIVSMLVDEAKEHIDEEAEERKDKAEAEKEKQEELEERIDAAKEEKKENEELTQNILEGVQEASANLADVSNAQQEIKDMMNKMQLIEDDIKGAAVDKSL